MNADNDAVYESFKAWWQAAGEDEAKATTRRGLALAAFRAAALLAAPATSFHATGASGPVWRGPDKPCGCTWLSGDCQFAKRRAEWNAQVTEPEPGGILEGPMLAAKIASRNRTE